MVLYEGFQGRLLHTTYVSIEPGLAGHILNWDLGIHTGVSPKGWKYNKSEFSFIGTSECARKLGTVSF